MLSIDSKPRSFGMVFLENHSATQHTLAVDVVGPGHEALVGSTSIAAGQRKLVARVDGAPVTVTVTVDDLDEIAVTYLTGPPSRGRGARANRPRR